MRVTVLCTILTIFFSLFSSSYGKVIYVDSEVSGEADTYHSIQEAIDNAKDGDEIVIKKGTYEENIVIKRPITLRGEPNQVVTITGNSNATNKPLCRARNVSGLLLQNIVFRPFCNESIERGDVLILGGDATVKDCKFEKASVAALNVSDNGNVKIYNSIFKDAGRSGVWVSGGETFVKAANCHFNNNKECGIHFYEGASGEISDCTFEENGAAGVFASGQRVRVSINGCSFINNLGAGVYVSTKASADVHNSQFESNRQGVYGTNALNILLVGNRVKQNVENGIYLEEVEKSTLAKNICKHNGYNGIYLNNGNESTLSENKSIQNKSNGFSFAGNSLKVEVKKNISKKNNWQGFFAGSGVEGNLRNNKSVMNSYNGIYLSDSDISLYENNCRDNLYSGISTDKGSMGIIQNNICVGNQRYGLAVLDFFTVPVLEDNFYENNKKGALSIEEPLFGRVREMMLKGEYDKLDSIASSLIDEETRNEEGTWQISWFHLSLTNRWYNRSSENRKKGISAVEKWINHSPTSQTPVSVLAGIYTNIGWGARGTGMASTVTPEGWEVFYYNLNKGLVLLKEAQNLEIKDPEFYTRMLVIGRGAGKSKDWMWNIFDEGNSLKKDYQNFYRQMAEYLLPKWRGSAAEVREFANQTIDTSQKGRSHIMYAFIMGGIWSCESSEGFMSLGFDYNKIKLGFEQLLDAYPNSAYSANRLCVFACMHGDKETARKLFPIVEKEIIKSIWKYDDEYFNNCKEWAFENNSTKD